MFRNTLLAASFAFVAAAATPARADVYSSAAAAFDAAQPLGPSVPADFGLGMIRCGVSSDADDLVVGTMLDFRWYDDPVVGRFAKLSVVLPIDQLSSELSFELFFTTELTDVDRKIVVRTFPSATDREPLLIFKFDPEPLTTWICWTPE